MATSLGRLGDLFPDKDIRCRIRGCNNTWNFSGEAALRNIAEGRSARPERMCDDCYTKFLTLEDKAVPCATPGCGNTWPWNRFQQLESMAQGHTSPPNGFCAACQEKLRAIQDKEMPCRVKGCTRTWVWPRQQQLLDPTGSPAPRMCRECALKLRELQDRDIPCRMRGCTRTWRWNRFQQLEHLVAGKELEPAPRRMCDECFRLFRDLRDTEVRCKVDECKRTWAYSAYAQLEHLLEHGPEAPPPSKMCNDCYSFFLASKDAQIGCRHRGCSGSWVYTRSQQLHDWLTGRHYPPPRMCDACSRKLSQAQDRLVPCAVPGCGGSWLYPALDQVKDGCVGRIEPPKRRCPACEEFLASHSAESLTCRHCAKPVPWSAYEQLLCRLGTFVQPSMCSDCASQQIAMDRSATAEPGKGQRPHHLVVRMPSAGRWNADEMIVNWPPHLTYDVIANAETADVRIVALGDELTYSAEDTMSSWPWLLEKALNTSLGGRARVAVANAGVPKTTTPQALLRFARDVTPFAPHLVIFSFTHADSHLWLNRHARSWRPAVEPEVAAEATHELCRKLKSAARRVLFWSTNPAFPMDYVREQLGEECTPWGMAQQVSREQCLALYGRICSEHGIPVLDLQSRFEVNGSRSAKKWMGDWCHHNTSGAQLIATWFAEHLLKEGMLPLPKPEEA